MSSLNLGFYTEWMDALTPAQRSSNMSKIRSQDTKPEMRIRRQLHALGYRYRLHDRRLPGKPDLVFAGRGKVIFINGCFWHAHNCPRGERLPKSNLEYWSQKRRRNQERDSVQRSKLVELGWAYMDVWECEIRSQEDCLRDIRTFLDA